MTRPKNDPLLTTADVADMLGWASAATVRAARKNGYLPEPDEPDEQTPANRRRVQWRRSTIAAFMANRPGAGFRTDLASAR